MSCIIHKWVHKEITSGLLKRGVTDRRHCQKCGEHQIKKAVYSNTWLTTGYIDPNPAQINSDKIKEFNIMNGLESD